MAPRAAWLLGLIIALVPHTAEAHDPSAWGGLFRSRDAGATWLPVNPVGFVSGAIALAISPVNPSHLLLATDSGVLASKNGGRDWTVEAPDVLVGASFAVAYAPDGVRALASGASGLYRSDGDRWLPIREPPGASPARALVPGAPSGRIYLAGRGGLYRSDDWGASWTDASGESPGGPVDSLIVDPGPPEVLYAIAGGRLWVSSDGARRWRESPARSPSGGVEAVGVDTSVAGRLWGVSSGHLIRSADRGERWIQIGRPLPEPRPTARSVVVLDLAVLVATDRGLYRSTDAGETWRLLSDNLPAHLEAGPLVRDPASVETIYAGFSLTPYAELWRRTAESKSALSRLDAPNLAGAAAFLILLFVLSIVAIRRLRTPRGRVSVVASTASPASTSGASTRP